MGGYMGGGITGESSEDKRTRELWEMQAEVDARIAQDKTRQRADIAAGTEQKDLTIREARRGRNRSNRASTILSQELGEPTQSGRKTLLGM